MRDSIPKYIHDILSKLKIYSQHFFEGMRRVFIETFFNLKFLSFDSEPKDGVESHGSEVTKILIVSELDLIQMKFYKQVMAWTLVIQ